MKKFVESGSNANDGISFRNVFDGNLTLYIVNKITAIGSQSNGSTSVTNKWHREPIVRNMVKGDDFISERRSVASATTCLASEIKSFWFLSKQGNRRSFQQIWVIDFRRGQIYHQLLGVGMNKAATLPSLPSVPLGLFPMTMLI